MANSKDRACSQLCPSPLPGAGGRQQNPISVARAPLLYPAGRGPPVWPTWSGPEWLEPRPAEGRSPSLLPAPSQEAPDIPLLLPQDPVPNGRGQFSAKWSPGGPKAIRTPPPAAGVAIVCGRAGFPALFPGFICLLWIRKACATLSPCFCPVSTPAPPGWERPDVCRRPLPSPVNCRQPRHPGSSSVKWGG